jgi:hypothetical protein
MPNITDLNKNFRMPFFIHKKAIMKFHPKTKGYKFRPIRAKGVTLCLTIGLLTKMWLKVMTCNLLPNKMLKLDEFRMKLYLSSIRLIR